MRILKKEEKVDPLDVEPVKEATRVVIEAPQWQDKILTQIKNIVLKERGGRREE